MKYRKPLEIKHMEWIPLTKKNTEIYLIDFIEDDCKLSKAVFISLLKILQENHNKIYYKKICNQNRFE